SRRSSRRRRATPRSPATRLTRRRSVDSTRPRPPSGQSCVSHAAVNLGCMPALIYGDTFRTPALRHEVPLGVPDPILYLESNGTRAVVSNALERPRLEAIGGLEIIGVEELGWDELVASGRPRWEIEFEVFVRAVEKFGLKEADVPAEFPLELADRLRERGVTV